MEVIAIVYIRKNYQWMIWLSIGILSSVLLAIYKTDIMESAAIRQVQAEELLLNWKGSGSYFIYLLLCRGIPFYLLVLLTYKTWRYFFFDVYFLYFGFSYGIQAFILSIEYGGSAVLLFIAQMLPQIIFYVPAVYLGYGLAKDDHSERGRRRVAVVALLLWSIGMATEVHINPLLIGACMKIFL